MSETYVIKEVGKKLWEIAKFEDYKEPTSIHRVSEKNNHFHCDCIGYKRQKDKNQHKHIKMVQFWKENLDEEPGYSFWFDGEDLEYKHFVSAKLEI